RSRAGADVWPARRPRAAHEPAVHLRLAARRGRRGPRPDDRRARARAAARTNRGVPAGRGRHLAYRGGRADARHALQLSRHRRRRPAAAVERARAPGHGAAAAAPLERGFEGTKQKPRRRGDRVVGGIESAFLGRGSMARQELRLVKERRLVDLIAPPKGSGVLEASGVIARGADFYVIFDNVRHVARIDRSLSPASKRHGWFGRRRAGDGYEDIAYSAANRRFYLLIEAEKHADGSYKPLIDECDEHGTFKGRRWVDIP